MNFIKLIQKFKDNRKNITIFFMFFVVFYLFSDVTFAASTDFWELKNKTAEFAEFLLKWISLLLALITYLATIFLSPTWINWSLFWLNVYFKEIWILVSNVVYFIFAFILIWIAFMNIIWKTWEMYQLKQAIPNFIVWVLIVPFSWFLVQFILSISAVLTVAWLSLPFDTFDEYEISLKWVTVPVDCTLNLQWFKANEEKGKSSNADDWFIYCDEKWEKKAITEIAKEWDAISSIFWVIAMYTYWVLSLDTMDEVAKIDTSLIKTMWDLIVKIVFDLLFVVIYSILMITLWLVLMIRWIYIWIYMMMSPVFWLMYFFGKSKWWDWFFAKFNLKEFIALAMVPVYTMLALSFWLLFLYVIWSWIAWSNKTSSIDEVSVQDDKIQVWQFNLKIIWAVSKEKNATNFLVNVWNGWLWIVWSLILKVFGIVVLWWTIMAAMRTSEITKEITEPIYKFGTQVWWIMTSLPGNIPIFPTGKGWMQSMQSLGYLWTKAQAHFNNKWSDRANKFAKEHWLFWETWDMQNNINNAKWITNTNETAPLLEKTFKDMDKKSELLTKPQFKDLLTEIANNKNSWANDEFKKYMNETLKGKKELTPVEVEKALQLLENPNIKLKYSSGTWNWTYKELVDYIKNLNNLTTNDNTSKSTNSSDDFDKITKTVVNNNIVFDLPWTWTINWKTVNWESTIESFQTDDYKRIAWYVSKNWLNNDWFNKLLNKLNVDSSKTDDIKKEVAKYFKDWEVNLSQDNWNISDFNDFLNKSNPNP